MSWICKTMFSIMNFYEMNSSSVKLDIHISFLFMKFNFESLKVIPALEKARICE